jgi:serine/threonine protein kinase
VKDKTENAKKLTVIGTTIGSPFYMAPEQAQGLDTLDQRADVWALAAIAYECLTGEVPFKGNNGPAILLEILTKNPTPPTELARSDRFAIHRELDAVMARAFQKNPTHRIRSVGELADQVGHAFGLGDTHKEWATRTQQELESAIRDGMPRMQEKVVARDSTADAFFGLGDDLGAVSGSSEASLNQEGSLAAQPRTDPSAILARSTSKWPVIAAVSGAVLLAALALILLFTL